MMAAFNVTVLADLGYNDTTRFIDPMEPRYRAVSFPLHDDTNRLGNFADDAIELKVNNFTSLDAYAHVADADNALLAYWSTHVASASTTLSTSTVKSSSITTITTATSKTSTTTSKTSTTKTTTSARTATSA